MSHVQAFNTLDEMFAAMKRQEDAANARVTDTQRQVVWGSYWKRTILGIGFIYGYVMTREEAMENSRQAGGDDEEVATEDSMLADAYERGYRFGIAYSVACPEGEYGSTHIADITSPISATEFEEAKRNDWLVHNDT